MNRKLKIAVIGSRTITNIDLNKYLPIENVELISGGARGVDELVARFARINNINLVELLPEYEKYGRGAPIVRNKQIVDSADKVIAFWDGASRGTLSVIQYCQKSGKELVLICIKKSRN